MGTLSSLCFLVLLGACTNDDPPAIAADSTAGVTIFDLQNPASTVVAGTHVVLDHAALRVTAVAGDRFYLQEADATGLCDTDDHSLDYRGIVVLAPASNVVVGERVRVEGDVVEVEGQTALANATVTHVAFETPYRAHCVRDATVYAQERYEGVLLLIGGSTEGQPAPTTTGDWSVVTCDHHVVGAIGARIYANPAWAEGFYWLTGVLEQEGDRYVLEPRGADDIIAAGDDVCL